METTNRTSALPGCLFLVALVVVPVIILFNSFRGDGALRRAEENAHGYLDRAIENLIALPPPALPTVAAATSSIKESGGQVIAVRNHGQRVEIDLRFRGVAGALFGPLEFELCATVGIESRGEDRHVSATDRRACG
ncbi:MAG TPA: hypothetical protein VM677_08295 [Actinokineospora sp.]|nr:hypothetical protein [Actinokineospora sp.]